MSESLNAPDEGPIVQITLRDTIDGRVDIHMASDPPMPANLDDVLAFKCHQYALAAAALFTMANDMQKHPADLIRFLKSRLKKLPKEAPKPPKPRIVMPGDK